MRRVMHTTVRWCVLALLGGCARCNDTTAEATAPPDQSWVDVPGGSFVVGSALDEPCRETDERQREVSVAAFMMNRFEVTQEDYRSVTGQSPSFHADCPRCPVERVSAKEAEAFCKQTGDRLPTEEEWERAARAGSRSHFYGGALQSCMATDPVAGRIGWYKANSGGFSHPVGGKQANSYGLYDMSGNVYEWTSSRQGDRQVARGGSWYHNAHHARSAKRMTIPGDARLSYVGFRCVKGAAP